MGIVRPGSPIRQLNFGRTGFGYRMPYYEYLAKLNPFALWKCNETSGSVIADTGTTGNKPLTPSPTSIFGGPRIGSMAPTSLQFSGVPVGGSNPTVASTSTVFTDLYPTNPLTLILWAIPYQLDLTGQGFVFSNFQLYDYGIQIFQFAGFASNGGGVNGATPLTANRTYMIAVTIDGTALKLYLNGMLDGSTNNYHPNTTSPGTITMGGGGVAGTPQYNGALAAVSFHASVLTAQQIAWLYDAGY